MSTKRKIFIIAGEASGDIYGGLIAGHLKGCELRGWGGKNMEAAGVKIATHYRDLAYMGLWEVLKNFLLKNGMSVKCEGVVRFGLFSTRKK